MGTAILNEQTIIDLVGQAEEFDHIVKERFRLLDTDGDGGLSCIELEESLGRGEDMPLEDQGDDSLDGLFARFDEDNDGVIQPEEFKSLFRELMLALARGIGGTPVLMALQPESFLDKAVQHELDKALRCQSTRNRKTEQIAIVSESTPRDIIKPTERARRLRSPRGGLLVCFFCGAQSTKHDS